MSSVGSHQEDFRAHYGLTLWNVGTGSGKATSAFNWTIQGCCCWHQKISISVQRQHPVSSRHPCSSFVMKSIRFSMFVLLFGYTLSIWSSLLLDVFAKSVHYRNSYRSQGNANKSHTDRLLPGRPVQQTALSLSLPASSLVHRTQLVWLTENKNIHSPPLLLLCLTTLELWTLDTFVCPVCVCPHMCMPPARPEFVMAIGGSNHQSRLFAKRNPECLVSIQSTLKSLQPMLIIRIFCLHSFLVTLPQYKQFTGTQALLHCVDSSTNQESKWKCPVISASSNPHSRITVTHTYHSLSQQTSKMIQRRQFSMFADLYRVGEELGR